MPRPGARRTTLATLVVALVGLLTLSSALDTPAEARSRHRLGAVGTPVPTAAAHGSLGLAWRAVANARRYRVVWSAKPYGGFHDAATAWVSSVTRRATVRVPTAYAGGSQDVLQTALPFGNPLFVKLQAADAHGHVRSSRWSRALYPTTTAGAGTPVRLGTWNLGQSLDASTVAAEVSSQGLSVVALQESRRDAERRSTAERVARRLGWSWTDSDQQQQLIWDPSRLVASRTEWVRVPDMKRRGSAVLELPAVRLTPVAGGRAFWVVSAHFVVTARSKPQNHAETATDARALTAAMSRVAGSEPVVVAGDLTCQRDPYSENSLGAQQVFVRAGYWDTRAAAARSGTSYPTLNAASPGVPHYPQPAIASGAGWRTDYLLSKGIRGASRYANVANRPHPVSDHNLVWSELRVP